MYLCIIVISYISRDCTTKSVVVVSHKNWLLLLRVVINCALCNNCYKIIKHLIKYM